MKYSELEKKLKSVKFAEEVSKNLIENFTPVEQQEVIHILKENLKENLYSKIYDSQVNLQISKSNLDMFICTCQL